MQQFNPLHAWGLMFFLSLIWGSSFILIKQSLVVYTPDQIGALRVAISSACFLPLFLIRRKRIPWQKWKYLLVVALCGSGIPSFLFPIAQTHVDSAIAGILNALTPICTLVVGLILFNQKVSRSSIFGIGIGLLGVILLSVHDLRFHGWGSGIYYLLIVLATLCYAISVNTVHTYLKQVDSITLSACAFLVLGPFTLSYLLTTDVDVRFMEWEGGKLAFFYVFLLSFFGTFLSVMVFFFLVHQTNAVFSSLVAYLIPIIALGWGIYFGESIRTTDIFGFACILSGVYLVKSG